MCCHKFTLLLGVASTSYVNTIHVLYIGAWTDLPCSCKRWQPMFGWRAKSGNPSQRHFLAAAHANHVKRRH